MSSFSKAKSQSFDPFADLGKLGPTLPGKTDPSDSWYHVTLRQWALLSMFCKSVIIMYINLLVPGSSSGSFSGPGFNPKSGASSKSAGQPWQQSGRPAAGQSKPWMAPSASAPKAQPPKPAPQPAKPNYNLNFSVIGGREERGVRGPGFGETTNHVTI